MLTITNEGKTAVPPTQLNHEATAALWTCDHCQVWWGSQKGPQSEARYLLQLAEPNTELFKWEDYRGWREKAATEQVCSECGQAVTSPRFMLFGQANGRVA